MAKGKGNSVLNRREFIIKIGGGFGAFLTFTSAGNNLQGY